MRDSNKQTEEKNEETRELFLDEPQGNLLTEAMMEIEDEEDDESDSNENRR